MLTRELHTAVGPWDIESSYRFCERLTSKHYENFPVASLFVPKDKRKFICSVYAFARIADDFADAPGSTVAERIDNLSRWQEHLDQCFDGSSSHPVFIALGETSRHCRIPRELFQDLLDAFRSDVTVHRHDSYESLLRYCSNSANPVGRIVLSIFDYQDEELFKLSDSLCTALQLTNFWQDVGLDARQGRIYMPAEDLSTFGYTYEQLIRGEFNGSFAEMMNFELSRTDRLFEAGRPLLERVGDELRLELALIWHGGRRILEKIRKNGFNVLSRRPTLTFWDKGLVVTRALSERRNMRKG